MLLIRDYLTIMTNRKELTKVQAPSVDLVAHLFV